MYMNVVYALKGPTMEIKFILFYSILIKFCSVLFIKENQIRVEYASKFPDMKV